ncbi:hypothetical protein NIES25_16740 [Nostoc linckia NIES-25]|nr:hypothetical protein NIES25_16740 [Nostoc linckia NIES-25]
MFMVIKKGRGQRAKGRRDLSLLLNARKRCVSDVGASPSARRVGSNGLRRPPNFQFGGSFSKGVRIPLEKRTFCPLPPAFCLLQSIYASLLHTIFIPVLVFWLLMLRKLQVAIMIFLLLMPTLSDLNLKQTHYNFSLKMA